MVAATGGVLLSAGDVAMGQPASNPKSTAPTSASGSPYSAAGHVQPAFTPLEFGEVKPRGWILAQMRRDLQTGFAGCLDELCHEASSDIFVSGRNRPGMTNNGNAANDSWWNGESEGNWRCGFIMLACLTQDSEAMAKAGAYVKHILASQDADGYIGIFSPELRYHGNGELWTQTCLFRGLLAYAAATADEQLFAALKRAVDCTIAGYAEQNSINLTQHDAMYTDILEPLYVKTGDKKYIEFALRLYRERANLAQFFRQPLDGEKFQRCYTDGHGATVAESMRMPFWFWTATGDRDYLKMGVNAIAAMNAFAMPSGALVSEESVDRPPHPWHVGYEYCAIFERQFSLINAGQKTGDAAYFQAAEHLWFNAAQGSREPDGSAILYCSEENRLSVHDEIGKRQRFSPTHQQIAVCCVPNSTRVAPYFVSNAWMRPEGPEPSLAATHYGPCEIKTRLNGVAVEIEERTNYPYSGDVRFTLRLETPLRFCLWLREPEWSNGTHIECHEVDIHRAGSFWQVRKEWNSGDSISIRFGQTIREVPAFDNEFALQYGPLLYVLPVKSETQTVRTYARPEFKDYFATRTQDAETDFALSADSDSTGYGFAPESRAGSSHDYPLDSPSMVLSGRMIRSNGASAAVTLVPMGASNTRLRRVTFPKAKRTQI
jgi:DUF1680 family protein